MAPKKSAMVSGDDTKLKPKSKPEKTKAVKLIMFRDIIEKRSPPPPLPPQEQLPLDYLNFITSHGAKPETLKLILIKRLEKTDTKEYQARVTLPKEKLMERFLSDEEELFLEGRYKEGGRDLKNKLAVLVVDPRLAVHELRFVRWNDEQQEEGEKKKKKKKIWWYALNGGWINLLWANGFQEDDAIQFWSFRFGEDDRLGFIVQKIIEDGSGSSSSLGSDLNLDLSLGSSSGSGSSGSSSGSSSDHKFIVEKIVEGDMGCDLSLGSSSSSGSV